jgi:hypothetical protein
MLREKLFSHCFRNVMGTSMNIDILYSESIEMYAYA